MAVKELKRDKISNLAVVDVGRVNNGKILTEREKFLAEAKIMSQLYHPKVPSGITIALLPVLLMLMMH